MLLVDLAIVLCVVLVIGFFEFNPFVLGEVGDDFGWGTLVMMLVACVVLVGFAHWMLR